MQKLVKDYLNDLKKQRKHRRRSVIAIVLLAVMVIGGVAGILEQYGVAMTGQADCGIEEHEHTDECREKTLVCGLEETEGHSHGEACYGESEAILVCGQEEGEEHTHEESCYAQSEAAIVCGQEESEGHVHGEECYEEQIVCGKEEHTHTSDCYTDTNTDTEADVDTDAENTEAPEEITDPEVQEMPDVQEDPQEWEMQYEDIQWEEAWGKDLVTAAREQIDYRGTTVVTEDGTERTYTRYGHFAGDMYLENWDAAFVNFCMYYAGLVEDTEELEVFPDETDSAAWREEFQEIREENTRYLAASETGYVPQAGDLIFFEEEKEGEESEYRTGIVSSYDEEQNELTVIEGNSQDQTVEENTYDAADETIDGYLETTELEENVKEELGEIPEEPENPEEDGEKVLTEEEQQQVDAVNELLASLPTEEEMEAARAELEEDEEAYNEYILRLTEQVQAAYDAYMALSEELRQYLDEEAVERLLMLYEMFGTMTLEEPEVAEHNTHITGFTITRTVDGTAPFDNHDRHTEKCYEANHSGDPNYLICKQHVYTSKDEESVAGDDRGAENLVVRTFDSVNYKFRVTMDTYAGSNDAITEARVKLQVILPAKKDQAAFNLEAMTWVDTEAGYEAKIENIIRDEKGGFRVAESEDDPDINGQLLTCWKHLEVA